MTSARLSEHENRTLMREQIRLVERALEGGVADDAMRAYCGGSRLTASTYYELLREAEERLADIVEAPVVRLANWKTYDVLDYPVADGWAHPFMDAMRKVYERISGRKV